MSTRERAKTYGPNDDCVQVGGLAFSVNISAKAVADKINAALAAVKLNTIAEDRALTHDVICDLQDKLSADREKVTPLVEALELARKWMPNSRCPTLNEEEAYRIIDDALAKVKEKP